MSQEPSSTEAIVTRIRELLGVTRDDAESALSQLSLERVLRLTRRQLLDGARYLGLTGLGRLTKDVLARQFLHALRGLVPVAEPEAEDTGDGPHKFDLGRPTEEGGSTPSVSPGATDRIVSRPWSSIPSGSTSTGR